ncbi:MAG: 30S ribosome-binding factor RbfA [Spirochaetaceae bacterium]|jgi:ribosome-binding factor A|nr:30S ribosome-binding factor RbfA [Spirochaetaceae bacterium]
MAEYRIERVGRLIQEKIGVLIVEGKIKDYRVNPFLSITRVSVSKDLAWADVYVSSFKSEGNLATGVTGLQSAAGFIQAQLAGQMHIRQTPKLRFHEDASIREGFDMVKKIEELREHERLGLSADV